jgi:hypothetical protein
MGTDRETAAISDALPGIGAALLEAFRAGVFRLDLFAHKIKPSDDAAGRGPSGAGHRADPNLPKLARSIKQPDDPHSTSGAKGGVP